MKETKETKAKNEAKETKREKGKVVEQAIAEAAAAVESVEQAARLTEPRVKRVTSLTELDALCRQPVTVRIPLASGDEVIEIEARRLTPAESAKVNLEMRRALPKIIPGDKPGQERFDLSDPTYFERDQTAKRRARALAVYLGVPLFRDEKPNLSNIDDITDYVQGKLTEEILTILFMAIVPSFAQEVQEAVNFFSSSGFQTT